MAPKVKNIQRTGYHLISSSPFPILAAWWRMIIFVQVFELFYYKDVEKTWECICDEQHYLYVFFIVLVYWWRRVNIEASYLGYHTKITQKMIRCGILLFILWEVMFFFSFFWAFFHRSLAPSPYIGNVWPPKGVPLPSSRGWPLLGTIILLTSRGAVTYCHRQIRREGTIPLWTPWFNFNREFLLGISSFFSFLREKLEEEVVAQGKIKKLQIVKILVNVFFYKKVYKFIRVCNYEWNPYKTARLRLLATIIIGGTFLQLQRFEYEHLGFSLNRGVYGSVFYLATSFHGLHVFVGVIFLGIQWQRIKRRHFSRADHVGLEGAIWYWHFVDVVWLVLYGWIYCWGNWQG